MIASAALLAVSLVVACQTGASPVAKTSVDPEPARRLFLTEYVPAAGLAYLIEAHPRALLKDGDLMDVWSKILSKKRLSEFSRSTGIDPRKMDALVIAGYSLGTVYLFDAKECGEALERSFRSRARSTEQKETDTMDLVHLTGVLDGTPHAAVHLRQHMFALVEGDISLARIVVAFAEGKLKKSPPSLRGSLISPHADFHRQASLRAFLVGPFESATDQVSAEFAAGVAAFSFSGDLVKVSVQASGVWQEPKAVSRFVDRVLESRTLRALGWGFPVEAPVPECEPAAPSALTFCRAQGTWNQRALAEATFRITVGSTEELTSDATPLGWTPEVIDSDLAGGLLVPPARDPVTPESPAVP